MHPNIELKLNTYVDVDTVKALNPDEVIVSPGGGIISLDVPGIDGKNVVKSEDIKEMCAGQGARGQGHASGRRTVAAIKAQGGTVGFMRMGLNMASGPRHRGQARRGRGRRLRRLGSCRGHVREP